MKNQEIATILYEIADILEMQGVQWKPKAYRRAAREIENLNIDIEEYYRKNKLEEISGVGKHIGGKIKEILETGKLKYFEKLKKQIPEGLDKLMQIPEIGPKTALRLNKELHIKNIEQLKKAIKENKLLKLRGFGEK